MRIVPIIWLTKNEIKDFIISDCVVEPIPGYTPATMSCGEEIKPYRVTFKSHSSGLSDLSIDQADIGEFQLNLDYLCKFGHLNKDAMSQMINKIVDVNKNDYIFFENFYADSDNCHRILSTKTQRLYKIINIYHFMKLEII